MTDSPSDGNTDVARYATHEIGLTASKPHANPFRDVEVTASLESPSGKARIVRGFHDGGRRWCVRVMPDEPGEWRYRTAATDATDPGLHGQEGRFRCVASDGHGLLRPHPENPYALAHEDGTPFFHMGDTCYNLTMLDRERQLLPYLDARAAQGFNVVRFTVYRHGPETWPFGGTLAEPDVDRFNVDFFRKFDKVLADLRGRGMLAELILENFYGGVMCQPQLWTAGRERAWLDYVLARYGAHAEVAYWTLANEYETYPDGKYRFDSPGDVEWARQTARYVRERDAFGHMIGVHPDRSDTVVGDLFGPGREFDIILRQTHGESHDLGGYSDGSGAGLERLVQRDRRFRKPVIVAEFGYEYNGHTKKGCNTSTDLLRRHAWRIVMGGGHFSAGFRGTVYNFTQEMTFDIANNGGAGAGQLAHLKRFMSECAFWRLEPRHERVWRPNLCLAHEGREYVCFMPQPPALDVDLREAAGTFSVEWLDPITGSRESGQDVQGGGRLTFESPFCPEALLRLRRRT